MSAATLRVLAISDFYAPRSGGVERVVAETAGRLAREGVAVEVLTRRLDPAAPGHEVVDRIPVWRVGGGPRSLAAEYRTLSREVGAWADRHLDRFDLAHAHLSLTALPLLGRLERRGIPLVATFYGPWHREYLAETADPAVPSRWPGWVRPLVRPAVAALLCRGQGRVLAAARRRIVLSAHSRRELVEFGYTDGASIAVVPGGVDVERFRPRPADEARRRLGLEDLGEPLLVSVRRLVPRMGLDRLIEAVARLGGVHPGIALAIGGVGPLRERLEQEAVRHGVANRVRFLGAVSEEDLPWLVAAADLAVVPTRALEGFGLPVLEAWAAGVPVVGTAVGALEETVTELHPGFLAARAEVPELSDAIALALAARSPALSERARSLALSYRWEVAASRLAGLYREVAGAGRGA